MMRVTGVSLFEERYSGIKYVELACDEDKTRTYLVPFYTDMSAQDFEKNLTAWGEEGKKWWEDFSGGHSAFKMTWDENHPYIETGLIECNEISLPQLQMLVASVIGAVPWPVYTTGYSTNSCGAIIIEEQEDDYGNVMETERDAEPAFEYYTELYFGDSHITNQYKKRIEEEKQLDAVLVVGEDDEDMPF